MRAFIAYPLSKPLTEKLVGYQYRLQRRAIPLKPYPGKNLHLTTAFLGEIPPETKDKLINIVSQVNQKTKPLQLKTTTLSGFPREERAGTLILKVGGADSKKLKKAVGDLHSQLKKHNFWVDQKPFVPHITLGRVNHPLNLTKIHVEPPDISFQLAAMVLFKSTLTESGPIYQPLSSI